MLKKIGVTLLLIILFFVSVSFVSAQFKSGTCAKPDGSNYCGYGGKSSDPNQYCYCDNACTSYSDCCTDFKQVCQIECKDSDGGQAFGVAGTTSNTKGASQSDLCSDSYNLVEYYCDKNGKVQSISYYCQNGCNEGQCTEEKPQCGNGVLEKGEQCDGEDFGGATCQSKGYAGGELICSQDCTEVSYGYCTTKAVCGNGICELKETKSCPQDCNATQLLKENVICYFQGATAEQKCYDTGGFGCSGIGKCKADVAGPKGSTIFWKSSCDNSSKTFKTLIDGQDEYIYFNCKVANQITCIDSDGGVNEFIPGKAYIVDPTIDPTLFDPLVYYDACLADGVTEYYCSYDKTTNQPTIQKVLVTCQYGCKDGACLFQQSKCGDGICEKGEECPQDCVIPPTTPITKQDVIDWINTNCNNPVTYSLPGTGAVVKKPIIIP